MSKKIRTVEDLEIGKYYTDEGTIFLRTQIQADTEARKKEIVEGAKEVTKLSLQAGREFVSAGQSLSWKKETKSSSENTGIKTPTGVPGTFGNSGTFGDSGSGSHSQKEGKKTNEAIATGGTKHNYITLQIKELIGIQNYSGSKNATTEKVGQEILDELLRVTASAITAAQ